MRKALAIFIFLASALVLFAAMDRSFINQLKQARYFDYLTPDGPAKHSLYHRLLVRSDRWRFGDLYGLCYLPEYRFKLEPFRKYPRNDTMETTRRDLYIIGDSYLADKEMEGAFPGFDRVVFLDARFPYGPITLDSSRQNFLILEFAERNLNGYTFDKTTETKWTPAQLQGKTNLNTSYRPPAATGELSLWNRFCNIFFNKDLSRNLETLLFDNPVFTRVKELKADLNYKLIGSLPKEVAVSTDKKRLLMNITVDTASSLSSFRIFDDRELTQLDENLATAEAYYRSIGFKSVFLSVVPNPVSIYDDKRMPYNHLLQRVERTTDLPVISVFNDFKSSKQNVYYRSDTHWNPLGFDMWIEEVNKKHLYQYH